MGERVGMGRWRAVVVALVALAAVRAQASYISSDERVEAQAEISVQGTAQHAGQENIEAVQERNEVKLGLRYFLVPVQQDLLGILHRPRISIQYRGRYDSIYDIRCGVPHAATTIAIASGKTSAALLRAENPDHLFASAEDHDNILAAILP